MTVKKPARKAKTKAKAKAKAAPLTKASAKRGAPKGNEFWKLRSSHGRGKDYKTPDALFAVAVEYFEAVEANPLREQKIFMHQGSIIKSGVTKMRAMTISGLCTFLDITKTTWDNYKKDIDFLSVTSRIEEIIRDYKFTGAAADMLNANIIARDLGLVDKQAREEVTETMAQRLRRLEGGNVSSPE